MVLMEMVNKSDLSDMYSDDGKILLKCPNVRRYRIEDGCEHVDDRAFEECDLLEILYIPETFSSDEVDKIIDIAPDSVEGFCVWDRPYVDEVLDVNEFWYNEDEAVADEYGVIYACGGKKLVTATKKELIGKDYYVPDGVLTICDGAFGFCDYVVLSVPRSIKSIGDYIFGYEGGRIEIRD